ncbi:hypothetical protein TRVL_06563 [Trypanosoma vivax]|nr:hypothetical protein TRVL_06563 [Trypanosoma vivax]
MMDPMQDSEGTNKQSASPPKHCLGSDKLSDGGDFTPPKGAFSESCGEAAGSFVDEETSTSDDDHVRESRTLRPLPGGAIVSSKDGNFNSALTGAADRLNEAFPLPLQVSSPPRAGSVCMSRRPSTRDTVAQDRQSYSISSAESSTLHKKFGIRAWNHDDSFDVSSSHGPSGETYLESRRRTDIVTFQRSGDSSKICSLQLSPMLWRGKSLVESKVCFAAPPLILNGEDGPQDHSCAEEGNCDTCVCVAGAVPGAGGTSRDALVEQNNATQGNDLQRSAMERFMETRSKGLSLLMETVRLSLQWIVDVLRSYGWK